MLHNHPGQLGGEVFLGIPYENDEGNLTPVPGVGYTYGWTSNPDYNQTWIEYANLYFPIILPAGTYRSYEPLTNLVGCPLNGDWTITVTDLWSIDNGNIFSWSIDFAPDLYPALESFSPDLVNWEWQDHPSIFYEDPDSISASPVNAGEVAYTFQVEDEFGCVWDTTVNIEVLPYTHPDCHSCAALIANFPDSTICFGDSVLIDVTTPLSAGAVTFESYDNYEIGASNHPVSNPYISSININSINPLTITNPVNDIVSICLDLETDTNSDISLFLIAPNGDQIPLSTNNGGIGANYTQTCFTPTATFPITTAPAPFTGNFLPEGNWQNFLGAPINGDWALRITDQGGASQMGRINWWNITFQTENEVTYDWAATTELSCLDCPTPMATPADDATYTVTASDIYGCSVTNEIEIDVQIDYFAPDVQLVDLPGGIVEVTWNDANPGNPFYEVNVNGTGWVPSNNGNLSHMINGLLFGNIINVQVRSFVLVAACAVGIGNASISYGFCTLEGVINSQGPYQVSCNGLCDADIQISAFNGVLPFTYQVTNTNNGAMFMQDDGNLMGLCFGNYEVIITDDEDCKDTLLFEVLNKDPIIVLANETKPVSCFGGTDGCAEATANGGVGGFTFVWNDPNMSIGAMVCGLSAGPAIVTATDTDGCKGSGVANIMQPDELTLDVSHTDVNCLGGNDGTATAMVGGGVEPYVYMWTGGDTPDQPTTGGLTEGTFNLIVTDANGCTITGSVDVMQPIDGLSLTLTPFSGCFGQNKNRVESDVMGGSPPYAYSWTPNISTDPDLDNLPIGNYSLTVTDNAGCTIAESVVVTHLPEILITLATDAPTCHNDDDGAIAANIVSGGSGMGYTFQWSTNPNDNDDFIQGLLGGLYYSVVVTDSEGCTGEAGIDMPNPPPPTPDPVDVNDASCFGYIDGSIEIIDVLNANLPVSYQWDAAAGGQTSSTATNLGAGDYNVVITDADMCTASVIYTIGQPDAINVDYDVTENECFGGEDASIDPSVSGGNPGYSFIWSNGSTAAKLTDIPSDQYFVSITDANGCLVEDSVFVDQPNVVSIDPIAKDVSCFGEMDGSVTIEAIGGSPPYRYSLDNDMYVGSKTLIALVAGDYPIYVKDANDCVYTSNVIINEPAEVFVDIEANGSTEDELTILSGEEIWMDANLTNAVGSVSYSWTAAWCGTLSCGDTLTDCDIEITCDNFYATPDFTNDYFLVIEDENGCQAKDQLQVHVKKIRLVEVPTGFTPNGDGLNEMLPVHGRSGTMIKLFQVFDRWGELLYQDTEIPINDTTRGWDGKFKSNDMPPGVYVWYIEAEYADGMTESFKGETTLLR